MPFRFNPILGTLNLVNNGTVTDVTATTPLASSGGTTPNLTIQQANTSQSGYLSASDWNTFNAKLDASRFNYITNSDAEVDTSGWNLYNDTGRTVAASIVISDLTYTAVASGDTGNGINIDYVFHATQPSSTPLVTVVSPTHITVAWYNGPTLANNPTATQLKAAWDAVPGAVALATVAITGTASNRQYITGSHLLADGGDTSPVDGTGGSVTGVTFTRSLVNPLVGSASFLFSKDANSREGTGVSTDFQINSLDKGQQLQISFAYSGSTNITLGSLSDVRVFLYDITNNSLIPVTSHSYISGPVNTAKTFTGQFTASSSSVNYRLILHIATTNVLSWDLQLDNVIINDVLNATAATQVPSVVLQSQAISGAVTDRMAVAWIDGAAQWVPATSAFNGDFWSMLGFATNIVGSTADIYVSGYLDGFSFGPFSGYNQYIDPSSAGGLTPLPSPFTDRYVIMGKAISSTAINIQPFKGQDLIQTSGVPRKGGLLTNNGANDGTGDQTLVVGTNGNVLVANSAAALGINWAPAVVASTPLTYTTATRALTIATATGSVAGALSAADWTTFNNKAPTASPTFTGVPVAPTAAAATNTTQIATTAFVTTADNLKANLASPTFTGVPAAPTAVAGTSTTQLATTAFVTTADNLKAPLASPTFTGDVNASTGNILVSTIGKGLQVKTGTNAKIGTAVLVGGTVTVSNTSVTANSRIFLTSQSDGGTPGFLRITAKTAATSFVITSSSGTDTSTVAWMIVESIP